jgi:cytochrome P450
VFFPPLRRNFKGIGPWSHFKALAIRFEQLVAEEIAARREAPGVQDDILSVLLAARYEDGSPSRLP